jgi:type III pantothenate kinase
VILTVNSGNSTTDWLLWQVSEIVGRGFCPSSKLELAGEQLIGLLGGHKISLCAVASVVSPLESLLTGILQQNCGCPPLFVGRDLALPEVLKVDGESSFGSDRLAAAVAARRRGVPSLVVDFGTALTVDLIGSEGDYKGGSILPGAGICLEALRAGTAGVKVSGPVEAVQPPVRETQGAVHAALSFGLAGAVDRLVEETLADISGEVLLLATGGAAELFLPLCRTQFLHVPDLVHEGLLIMATATLEGAGLYGDASPE